MPASAGDFHWSVVVFLCVCVRIVLRQGFYAQCDFLLFRAMEEHFIMYACPFSGTTYTDILDDEDAGDRIEEYGVVYPRVSSWTRIQVVIHRLILPSLAAKFVEICEAVFYIRKREAGFVTWDHCGNGQQMDSLHW